MWKIDPLKLSPAARACHERVGDKLAGEIGVICDDIRSRIACGDKADHVRRDMVERGHYVASCVGLGRDDPCRLETVAWVAEVTDQAIASSRPRLRLVRF